MKCTYVDDKYMNFMTPNTKVLPSRPLSAGRQVNRVSTDKNREQGGIIILQVKPFLSPSFH
jgi:hypothetical protein